MRAAEGEITLTADSLKQGLVKLDKWVWKKMLLKLYKSQEERSQIECRVIENIIEINQTIGSSQQQTIDSNVKSPIKRKLLMFSSPQSNSRKRSRSASIYQRGGTSITLKQKKGE